MWMRLLEHVEVGQSRAQPKSQILLSRQNTYHLGYLQIFFFIIQKTDFKSSKKNSLKVNRLDCFKDKDFFF